MTPQNSKDGLSSLRRYPFPLLPGVPASTTVGSMADCHSSWHLVAVLTTCPPSLHHLICRLGPRRGKGGMGGLHSRWCKFRWAPESECPSPFAPRHLTCPPVFLTCLKTRACHCLLQSLPPPPPGPAEGSRGCESFSLVREGGRSQLGKKQKCWS